MVLSKNGQVDFVKIVSIEDEKKYILSVAEQYKKQLNINVYNKLINYEIQNNRSKKRS